VVETVVERLFARKIAQVIGDAIPTGDDDSNLLDRESQLDLFRWREGHITASVAQRFKRVSTTALSRSRCSGPSRITP
jgi:hypothetical protein